MNYCQVWSNAYGIVNFSSVNNRYFLLNIFDEMSLYITEIKVHVISRQNFLEKGLCVY